MSENAAADAALAIDLHRQPKGEIMKMTNIAEHQEPEALTKSLVEFEGMPDPLIDGGTLSKAQRDTNRRAYWHDRLKGIHQTVGMHVVYDGGKCRGIFPDSNALGQFLFTANPPLSGNRFSTIVGSEDQHLRPACVCVSATHFESNFASAPHASKMHQLTTIVSTNNAASTT